MVVTEKKFQEVIEQMNTILTKLNDRLTKLEEAKQTPAKKNLTNK